ncbi:MAG: hypothetical protein ABIH66_12590 [bacterium]
MEPIEEQVAKDEYTWRAAMRALRGHSDVWILSFVSSAVIILCIYELLFFYFTKFSASLNVGGWTREFTGGDYPYMTRGVVVLLLSFLYCGIQGKIAEIIRGIQSGDSIISLCAKYSMRQYVIFLSSVLPFGVFWFQIAIVQLLFFQIDIRGFFVVYIVMYALTLAIAVFLLQVLRYANFLIVLDGQKPVEAIKIGMDFIVRKKRGVPKNRTDRILVLVTILSIIILYFCFLLRIGRLGDAFPYSQLLIIGLLAVAGVLMAVSHPLMIYLDLKWGRSIIPFIKDCPYGWLKSFLPVLKLTVVFAGIVIVAEAFLYTVGWKEWSKIKPLISGGDKGGFYSLFHATDLSFNKMFEMWGRLRDDVQSECLGPGSHLSLSSRGGLAFVTVNQKGQAVGAIRGVKDDKVKLIAPVFQNEDRIELDWSNDGDMLLYPDINGNLVLYNVDTKESQVIEKCGGKSFLLGRFLPGDNFIRVRCYERDARGRLKWFNPSIRDLEGNLVWEFEPCCPQDESYSADGSVIYYIASKNESKRGYDIWKVDLVTLKTEKITDTPQQETSLNLWKDCYLYYTEGGGLYRIDLESKEQKRFFKDTRMGKNILKFNILDSGSLLLYTGRSACSVNRIFSSDMEGGNAEEIIRPQSASLHDPSPDGESIIAHKCASSSPHNTWIYSMPEKKSFEVEPYLVEKDNFFWSPDGKSLYFQNRYHIWRYDVAD